MANENKKANKTKLPAAVSLKVLRDASYLAADCSEAETSSRFLQAAALLPAEEFLGLQIHTEKDGPCRLCAFSSAAAYAAPEDLDWIFHDYAEASPLEPAGVPEEGGRRVYMLRPAGTADGKKQRTPARPHLQAYGYEDPDNAGTLSFRSLLSELRQAGGSLQIQVYGGAKDAQGSVLVSLPDGMTLRLRTALCLAFPDTLPAEAGEGASEGGGLLPARCLEEGLPELLVALSCLAPAWQPPEPDPEQAEEEADGKSEADAFCEDIFGKPESTGSGQPDDTCTDLPDDAGIEELDLSVRSFNCLKRAGIHTLGELRGMSGEELSHVRNLSPRCRREVLQKLAGPDPSLPSPTQQLEELIGLEGVKEQVRRITAFARLKQALAAQNQPAVPMVLNMVFTGSPGTAKTTVARIMAGILHETGLLPGRVPVEVGRADLVAKYVGHTAGRIREIFRKAEGKVLFIDEAYALADSNNGSFGDEAINTIVQEMENHRDDTVVIFAGYPDKMEEFLARNPGLRSRVPFQIHFEDYSAGEMARIVALEAKRRGFSVRPEALQKAETLCGAAAGRTELGNGRFCRNLTESAILRYAMRVYGQPDAAENTPASPGALPPPELVLEAEDFCLPEGLQKPERPVIGFCTRPARLSA